MPRNTISELQNEESVSSPLRRSSRIVNSAAPDLSVRITRTRRTSVDSVASSVASEKDEKPAVLKSRRTSALSEDDSKEIPASPRRGRPKIDKSEPIKTRRASIQKEKESEPVKATRSRRSSIQQDDTSPKSALPISRKSSKEEVKEEPKRTLRTRKSSVEAQNTPSNKTVIDKEKKPRGRRPSIESPSIENIATPTKVTRRRGSGAIKTPEKAITIEKTEPDSEPSIKLTPISKKNNKMDVANLSTIDEDAIDSDLNQEKSPRKSPRLLSKSKTDNDSSLTENVSDSTKIEELSKTSPLSKLSPVKRKISNDPALEPVRKSPRKSLIIDENNSQITDGLDGSFTFHLNESLEEKVGKSKESSLNVSINSNSDKENASPDKSTNQQEKSIIGNEDINEGNEIDKNNDISFAVQQPEPTKRISNVFRPKHKECSFLEPMEVDFNDTNMVGIEIENKDSEKSPEMDKSLDLATDLKRSDSTESSDFELEVKSEDEAKIFQTTENLNSSSGSKSSYLLNKSFEQENDEVFELPTKTKLIIECNEDQDEAEDEGFKSQQDKSEETMSDVERSLKRALDQSDLQKISPIEVNLRKSINKIESKSIEEDMKTSRKSSEIIVENSTDLVEVPDNKEKTKMAPKNSLNQSKSDLKSEKRKSLNKSQQKIDESSDINEDKEKSKITDLCENEIIEDNSNSVDPSKSDKKRRSLNENLNKNRQSLEEKSIVVESRRSMELKKSQRKSFSEFTENVEDPIASTSNTIIKNALEDDLKTLKEEPKPDKKRKSLNRSQQNIEDSFSKKNDIEEEITLRKSVESKDNLKDKIQKNESVEYKVNSKSGAEVLKSEKKRKSINKSQTIDVENTSINEDNLQKVNRRSKNVSDEDKSDTSKFSLDKSVENLINHEDSQIVNEIKSVPEKRRSSNSNNIKTAELAEENQLGNKNKEKNAPKKEQNGDQASKSDTEDINIKIKKRKSDTALQSPPKKIQNTSTNSKLDDYLTMKLKEVDENEDNMSSNSSNVSDSFFDDMAEEGEEDTPSEDSNQIIDEGESIGSFDSEAGTDEEYEHDSFVCDDEEEKLLSGEEYDLSFDTKKEKKKSKIIDISQESSDEEESKIYLIGQNAKKVDKEEKPKVRNRIISVPDSSEEEVDIEELLDVEQDKLSKSESVDKINETANDSLKVPADTKKRTSSITIIENISVDEVKDEPLKQRISQLVENFTAGFTKGEIAVNLSLEHIETNNESTLMNEGNQIEQEIVKISPNKETNSFSEFEGTKRFEESKISDCVLTKPIANEIVSPSKDIQLEKVDPVDLEISTNDLIYSTEEDSDSDSEQQKKLPSKQKLKNKYTIDIPKKLKKQMKPSKENKLKLNKNKEVKIKEMISDLKKGTSSAWDELVTDVKNRTKRAMKPSTSSTTDANWVTEEVNKRVKPSTSLLTRKEKAQCKFSNFHPKDFKNQMLYNSNRVKRMDSQGLIKKKKGLN